MIVLFILSQEVIFFLPDTIKYTLPIKGRKGTKPGTLLKQQIAIRTWAEWDENCPGFMEIDLVAHEGGNSWGDFAQTLNMVDVWSGWTELVAIKTKLQNG
ncbi:hypothetical protein [Thermospira aquatica]|uniref:Uncharacterized protein n=1 Tax=Thermospira aquatica TaxID=2828656 RepID=A0AAX3BBM2_9SPIR|nr:hypothetical protein [Thermospira aquatica]URA09681.1 hypothetical protein KDW03_09350 [Thermospira aquatica]